MSSYRKRPAVSPSDPQGRNLVGVRVRKISNGGMVIVLSSSGKMTQCGIFPLGGRGDFHESWALTPECRGGGGYSLSGEGVTVFFDKKSAISGAFREALKMID